jgi:hypothetical protein
MPKFVNSVPRLRRHQRGQAFVQLGGQYIYLGRYGTEAARLAYDAFLARWIAAGRPAQIAVKDEVTVSALVLAFWRRECKPYLSPGELHPMKSSLRLLRKLFGPEPAAEFTPRKLKIVRSAMIAKGWTRKSINKQVQRIRNAFR